MRSEVSNGALLLTVTFMAGLIWYNIRWVERVTKRVAVKVHMRQVNSVGGLSSSERLSHSLNGWIGEYRGRLVRRNCAASWARLRSRLNSSSSLGEVTGLGVPSSEVASNDPLERLSTELAIDMRMGGESRSELTSVGRVLRKRR